MSGKASSDYHRFEVEKQQKEYDYDDASDETEIYIVRQNVGYMAIIFSVVQALVLTIMMIQCGVAPMNVNPMVGPFPDALSEWGGKNSVLILDDGEWWLMQPNLLRW